LRNYEEDADHAKNTLQDPSDRFEGARVCPQQAEAAGSVYADREALRAGGVRDVRAQLPGRALGARSR
jgi:hypothetical protein